MSKPDYESIKSAVIEAGYFTTSIRRQDTAEQLIFASQRRADGAGLTGNSSWIALRGGHWHLATWGPAFYRFPDDADIAAICIEWLGVTNKTVASLSPSFRDKHGLELLSKEKADLVFPETVGQQPQRYTDN